MALWGRGMRSGFQGRDGELTLGGDVSTAMIGADWSSGSWLAGVAFAGSAGGGTWQSGSGGGDVESSLAGVYPYFKHEAAERISLWATAGYGEGELALRTSDETLRTRISMTMAAAGARGGLVNREGPEGPALALEVDGLVVRATSEATTGMRASDADASRLRLRLKGDWRHAVDSGGWLTPSIDAGLRRDGGDAETGFGADIGGGLAFADAVGAFRITLSARTLLGHEDDDYRDWGVSGSVRYDLQPDSERGFVLLIRQDLGGAASGGADSLLGRETMAGLGATETLAGNGRFAGEASYGLPVLGGKFTGTAHARIGLSGSGRDFALGWRFGRARRAGVDVSAGIEGTRRWGAGGGAPEHGIALRFTTRW